MDSPQGMCALHRGRISSEEMKADPRLIGGTGSEVLLGRARKLAAFGKDREKRAPPLTSIPTASSSTPFVPMAWHVLFSCGLGHLLVHLIHQSERHQ